MLRTTGVQPRWASTLLVGAMFIASAFIAPIPAHASPLPTESRAVSTWRFCLLGCGQVFGKDMSLGTSISADGRCVAFTSDATNLEPGDTNGCSDVFVKDMQAGSVVRASTTATGAQIDCNVDNPPMGVVCV